MTWLTHWSFLARLAWRDLTDRTARRATAVVVLTVAAAVAFAEIGYGFTYGVQRVQEARLRADPLALCVWVGSPLYRYNLTDADIALIRREADGAAGANVRGVAPCRQLLLRFHTSDGQALIDGRTVKLGPGGDLLFEGRPVRGGDAPTDPSTRGLFVTGGLLQKLGLPPDRAPPALKVAFGAGRVEEVPVGGLIDAIPFDHQFVATEQFAAELALRDSDVTARRAFSGPIGADWPNDLDPAALKANLPAAADKLFVDEELTVVWSAGPGRGLWIVSSPDVNRGYGEWADLLARIGRAMTGAGKAPAATFAAPELRDAPGLRTQRNDYDLVAVYVDDLRALDPVATAVGAMHLRGEGGLPVNGEVAKQYRKVGEQTARTERAMGYVSGFVAFLAGAVAFALLRLRAEHHVAETGMLRAMGMSRRSLATVAALQGVYVWTLGGAVGTAVGLWGIGVAAELLPDGDPSLGTYREPRLMAAILGAALLVCMVSAWGAGSAARRLSPAEALGTAL